MRDWTVEQQVRHDQLEAERGLTDNFFKVAKKIHDSSNQWYVWVGEDESEVEVTDPEEWSSLGPLQS